MNKVLGTICARGGSKGVVGKNIKNLLGKPLIAYTISQALESNLFDHLVVSTNCDKIADVAKYYGAEVFFIRSEDLSSDSAGKLLVVRDALEKSEEHFDCRFDTLIDMDATSPLRLSTDILSSYEQFIQDDCDNLLTGMIAHRNPYFNLVERDSSGNIVLSKSCEASIVSRQQAPECYDLNASIYIWKRDIILNGSDTIFQKKTGMYVMPPERSIDIDSELDFFIVESLMEKKEC